MAIKYKRVLLKMSGEALGGKDAPIDFQMVAEAASQIKLLHDMGAQVAIVVGGGNIMRGRSSGTMDRNRADAMGMLATAINSLALEQALIDVNLSVQVFSAVDINLFMDAYTARGANSALDEGRVVIFACGLGAPFFSTDTAAALRAAQIHADALLLAKNVDGVYSSDPAKDKDAVKYDYLSYDDVIKKQLRATDLTAITLCNDTRIPIIVFSMRDSDAFAGAIMGENVGTVIS